MKAFKPRLSKAVHGGTTVPNPIVHLGIYPGELKDGSPHTNPLFMAAALLLIAQTWKQSGYSSVGA